MANSRKARITIPDVAKAAGVSTAAAGRALGDYGYVSEEVRTKVLEAASELGYRANHVARSLITGSTRTIGVVGADIDNPFFAGAMRGVGDVARHHGFGALLTNSDEDVQVEQEAIQLLQQHQVDGIIIAVSNVRESQHLKEVIAAGTPVVLLDRAVADLDADSVTIDNVAAARRAVTYLLEQGHVRIAVVAELRNPTETRWNELLVPGHDVDPHILNPSGSRLLGYLEAHWEHGIEVDERLVRRTGEYTRDSARRVTTEALALPAPPTAIFTVDNLMSSGAYQALKEERVAVPEDVSLVAFDDLDWMSYVSPTITAVEQPTYRMGSEAARLLLERIEDPELPPRQRTLETTLVRRESTRELASLSVRDA